MNLTRKTKIFLNNQKIYFNHISDNLVLETPSKNDASYLESDWAISIFFSNFTSKDIWQMVIAILLEKSIIFYSENVSLLTATIHSLNCIIKPFEWPNPLIFNLPINYIHIFDSPVPIIVGNFNFII